MMNNDVIFGTVPFENVAISEREVMARIGAKADLEDENIARIFSKLADTACYRYAYTRVSVCVDGNTCNLGFASVNSSSLSRVLSDSSEAFIIAVTAGLDVDRLISRAMIQNKAEAFLIDGIASAAVESLADHIQRKICEGIDLTKRFSPGYADFPLEFQASLLERLNAERTLGIRLSKDLLMTPMKSITAIIGIK